MVNQTFLPAESRVGTVNGFFINFAWPPPSPGAASTPNPAEKLRYFSFTSDPRMLRFRRGGPKIQTSLSSLNGFRGFPTGLWGAERPACVKCHADALQAVGNKYRLRGVHRFGLTLFLFRAKP
jgi:hypothetical protein